MLRSVDLQPAISERYFVLSAYDLRSWSPRPSLSEGAICRTADTYFCALYNTYLTRICDPRHRRDHVKSVLYVLDTNRGKKRGNILHVYVHCDGELCALAIECDSITQHGQRTPESLWIDWNRVK